MPRRRYDLEKSEARHLAPYAQNSSTSRGREHPEDQHRFRLDFQRDRDRIVHSRSFRRLEYKTQVFLNGTGDHYRTRMTHTIEVSCIARTLARSLGLNEDLAEAIALAHDLGHPPFGHLGEETLHRLMSNHGGFLHNAQSLRVVE
jgi:dGTPase